jgi:hypothetical protein
MSQLASEIRNPGNQSSTNYWSLGIVTIAGQDGARHSLPAPVHTGVNRAARDLPSSPAAAYCKSQIRCFFPDEGNNREHSGENNSEKSSEFFTSSWTPHKYE